MMDEITKTTSVDSSITPGFGGMRLGKVFLKRKWFPFLGAAIGAFVGIVYFALLPNQYIATAKVQFVTEDKEAKPNPELAILKSDAVLRSAVEQVDLSKSRDLGGRSVAETTGMLQDPTRRMLEVRLVSDDINSKVVDVSVVTSDSKLSGEIVTAIVNSYERYMMRNFGSKVSKLDVPMMGSFAGPYWVTYFLVGTLLGFVACSFIAISGTPEFLTRRFVRQTAVAVSAKSTSYQSSRSNLASARQA
jgi:capsular polysaccharide biosynthesis protein